MAYTYSKIATYTVGSGGVASINFLNIPQNYTDLVIKFSTRDNVANFSSNLQISYNGNTSSIYTTKILYGDGSATYSLERTPQGNYDFQFSNASSSTSNVFSNGEVYIPNYTSSNYKSSSSDSVTENNATASAVGLSASLFSNTSAITSITLKSAGTISQYSTAHLYGIKAEL
jgi:hypothetical protein